jgi:hypothetical protein
MIGTHTSVAAEEVTIAATGCAEIIVVDLVRKR